MRRFTTRSMSSVAAAVGVCISQAAISQNQKQPAEQQTQPVLAINSAGMDAWLTSEKDRGLRHLLEMIEPRLAELPSELKRLGVEEAGEIPPGMLETVWGIAMRPQALELRLNLSRLKEQSLPVDIRWAAIAEDLPAASNTIGIVREALRDTPVELRAGDEMGVFIAETPAIPVYFGTKQSEQSPLVFLSTETDALPDFNARYADLPDGVTPLMSMRFDLAQLTPVIGMPIGVAPPIVGELLMEGGFVGWDATRFDLSVGQNQRHAVAVARMTGAARAARLFAIDPERMLAPADLHLIPADATYVSAGLYDPTRTLDLVRRVMESLGIWEEAVNNLRDEAQIDVATIETFVKSLGDSWVMYQSDSTGGGEIASIVLSVSLRDAETFERALITAIGRANAIGEREGKGYFRIRSSELGGARMYSINSPGLPFPAEPSMAVSEDRVFIALSVPSLRAAIDQQQRGMTSIATRKDVLNMAGGSLDGIAGFAFVDTQRYARRGYATMNHLMAALANGVRSPDSEREPYSTAVAMPSFAEFVEGVSPAVTITRWDGEDLVIMSRADRSMTVQLAAGLGRANLGSVGAQVMPMMGVGLVSGLREAREQARSASDRTRSVRGVRELAMAAISYASERGGGLPGSTDALVEAGFIEPEDLDSPFGSMMGGRFDIVIRTDLAGKELSYDSGQVLAIDRSAASYEGEAAVAFMDGHVEWLQYRQIDELLNEPKNRGARKDFGF